MDCKLLLLITCIGVVSGESRGTEISECTARNLTEASLNSRTCVRPCKCFSPERDNATSLTCTCKRQKRECVCDGECGHSCVQTNIPLCPTPRIRHGTYIASNPNLTFGTNVTYQCKRGYRGSVNVRICQGDGSWSGASPKCRLPPLADRMNVDFNRCGIAGDIRPKFDGNIVGGADANTGAWRWQAAIYAKEYEFQVDPFFICGGSLISEYWVLTAAHCFLRHIRDTYVIYLGMTKRFEDRNKTATIKRKISQVILHPMFDIAVDAPFDYDLALVKLDERVISTLFVGPVCLPSPSQSSKLIPLNPAEKDRATLTGWGHPFPRTRESYHQIVIKNNLQQVSLPLVRRSVCFRSLERDGEDETYKLTLRMFCAGFPQRTIGSCRGDSGSPLVRKVRGNRWVQIGISSWGRGCAMRNEYDYFTHLPRLFNWINSTTNRTIHTI